MDIVTGDFFSRQFRLLEKSSDSYLSFSSSMVREGDGGKLTRKGGSRLYICQLGETFYQGMQEHLTETEKKITYKNFIFKFSLLMPPLFYHLSEPDSSPMN